MTKLMNTQNMWQSIEYTHTSSDGGTDYTLNHNFGKTPDLIECYTKVSGSLTQLPDIYLTGANVPYGWLKQSDPSINQSIVRVYRNPIGGSTFTLVIRCFNLGTTQTITNITPAFQWSTSEQVWPFEKAADGSTLYCKEVACGGMPNNGSVQTAHNIANFTASKVYSYFGYARDVTGQNVITLPSSFPGNTIACWLTATNVYIYNTQDWSSYSTSSVKIIYSK